ncbi:SRPBCC family protein [Arthrobacter sp. 92]|uniref:SRPBCC family protein n=1 Tax=Arthrobacter sp. 92 TaxID=3418175 RepID=UPI003D04C8E3
MKRKPIPPELAVAATLVCLVSCGLLFRRIQLRWGATTAECDVDLPGDGFIRSPALEATRAVSIKAPATQVWPWLAQLGQGRGGFYSYDVLENLIGLDVRSADRVHPEWQGTDIGDRIHLAPAPTAYLEVADIAPDELLVLRSPREVPAPFDFTWAFVLQQRPDGTTRLLVRERYACRRWWARLLVETVEVASFVMSTRMLHGIRSRAENTRRRVRRGEIAGPEATGPVEGRPFEERPMALPM